MQNGNMKMKIVIDIDGVICSHEKDGNYENAKPYMKRIIHLNKLYFNGHHIVYFTSRGYETGIDWEEITKKQFEEWHVKYHELIFGKPSADYYLDDKNLKIEDVFG